MADDDPRLEEVILEYLQAVDAGRTPELAEYLARHPDLAPQLREFFADQQAVASRVAPLGALAGTGEESRAGQRVGDYELLAEIGRGGMGVVYRARQCHTDKIVALKMIRDRLLGRPADVERFRREAEHAGSLRHPNIVPIHEVGSHDGHLFFSMRLVAGGSLAQHPRSCAGEWPALGRLLATVARAVAYAHQQGILHRDLKPANILLEGHEPFVADFGLARRVTDAQRLTRSGVILGTPGYMAPEQALGERTLTPTADVYSLGAILYHLLTGRPPFRGANLIDTLLQVQQADPMRPSEVDANVDRDLERICLKCLDRDPNRRYASAASLADDLERVGRGQPIRARPAGLLARLGRWFQR